MFDRKTVKPALLVLALAVLEAVVFPAIDRSASYRHPVRRGDVAQLATGITLVPTPGWDLASGALAGHARTPVGTTAQTDLIHGSVDLYVQAAPFTGTPSALLRRVDRISSELHHARGSAAASRSYAVRTRQGAAGVGQDFHGVDKQGSVVAFVFRSPGQRTREGVEIVVSGPRGPISRRRSDIVAMIRSIRAAP